MKAIDLGDTEDVALITINDFIIDDGNISIDIWGYHGQSLLIDISEADNHEIKINLFELVSHNYLEFKFAVKKHLVKIKNLVLRYAGVNYLGGAEVDNLEIISNRLQRLNSNIANNVKIQTKLHEDEEIIRKLLGAIEIIPGCGEYLLNKNTALKSLVELKTALPNIKWIAPVASWFGDSLDIATCRIFPGIESNYIYRGAWKVSGYDRHNAHLISYDAQNQINYGGSIYDQGVVEFLSIAKAQDLNIIFYPLIMIDTPKKPWRGHLTGGVEDVEGFYQNYYKPFIIHYANLVKDKVDAFIIGSELIGLTRIHTKDNIFPFVQKLIELAAEVRAIVGLRVKITYAADWSEYHTSDGTLRPLDELWACRNIDFVGIDAYFPLTNTTKSRATVDEIKAGWKSGEGWDYWIDSLGIKQSFNNEGWNQWKNLQYWWETEHLVWSEAEGKSIKTAWQPKMKPIWFTEFGFPSIDKASNKPNVFYDPKSSDGGVPTYSTGKPDYAIQRKALRATLEFWQNSEFLENMICWTWDARGLDWRNTKDDDRRVDYYADAPLWEYGHWIDGKIGNSGRVVLSGKLNFNTLRIDTEYLIIESLLTETYYERTYGSKSVHKIYDQYITITSITASKCKLIVKNNCLINGSVLNIEELYIKAGSMNLEAMVTNHSREEIFKGKKDWCTNKRQESVIKNTWQELYFTEINCKYGVFEIEGLFVTKAIKMNLNDIDLTAGDFEFSGMKLEHSYIKQARSKGGLFTPTKRWSENCNYEGVEGTMINIAGKGFMLGKGSIWLAGTAIKAKDLELESPKIELSSLIGIQYHGIKFSKTGARLSLTCKPSELSIGPEIYMRQFISEHYKEYAYPSFLIGTDILKIKTDIFSQNGGILAGKVGQIKAGSWSATATRLLEYHSDSYLEMSIGFKVGIKENVSGFIGSAKATGNSMQQLSAGNNRFAALNTAFNAYNTVTSAAQLASGNVISAGGFLTVGVTFASSDSTSVTYFMNQATFDSLSAQISGEINGDLEMRASNLDIRASGVNLSTPQDEHSYEADSTSIGFEFGKKLGGGKSAGFCFSHHQQSNDQIAGFGLGYNSQGGIGPISVIYGDGDDLLDVSFKSTSLAELQLAFRDGAFERMRNNISSTMGEICGAISQPLVRGLAGTDDFDSVQEWPVVVNARDVEESQNQKLANYTKQINEQLEKHSILPSEMSSKDKELVLKIRQEVKEQYPNLSKADQGKKVAQSYFLVKECQEHPERTPPMQLAMAGVAIPIMEFVGWLIGVIVAYKAAEDAPKIARILLDSEESEEYNELHKFEKKRHGDKNKPLPTPKPADFKTPNIDPDDFEPEEDPDNDKFTHFKKKDGSNRYECEKTESPEWNKAENFKSEFKTNGQNGKNREYYRWDHKHKDIEVYNGKAELIGSKDPITGRMYRKGNMQPSNKLKSIIK